jgi:hypothetical protein
MGTRADFYIKKADEPELVWIASIARDGYPDGIDKEILNAKSQTDYIASLQKFISKRDDVTLPEYGWPWPWDDSNTTDYGYCFHDGVVHANCFGHGWYSPDSKDEEPDIIWEHEYPNMEKIKNVRYDKGSGLIVLTARQ